MKQDLSGDCYQHISLRYRSVRSLFSQYFSPSMSTGHGVALSSSDVMTAIIKVFESINHLTKQKSVSITSSNCFW